MTAGPIEPWAGSSRTRRAALGGLLAGELGGYLALAAAFSPLGALRVGHGWLVSWGVDPTAAAAAVVACAVGRWLVGVALFAARAVEW